MSVIDSFELHLRAEGKAPKTIETYTSAVRKLASGRPDIPTSKVEIEQHIAKLLANYSPGYASNQYRALKRFFAWYAEEFEVPNPMNGMRGPNPVPPVVPVLGAEEMEKLLATCRGKSRKDRRDFAVLRLFADTGLRLSELANISMSDIDLRARETLVTGKASRQRWVRFTSETARAIDRYLRVAPTSMADRRLFGLTGSGIYQMVKRRGQQAGITLHPHMYRHTFAHTFLARGGQEGDLLHLAGWSSSQMLKRYGASAASARARTNYDKIMGG